MPDTKNSLEIALSQLKNLDSSDIDNPKARSLIHEIKMISDNLTDNRRFPSSQSYWK